MAETILNCYPEVYAFDSAYKYSVSEMPNRIREFRKRPNNPKPLQLILTSWGTWLRAAFNYLQYFQKINAVVSKFVSNKAIVIKKIK